jgi:hypothetical protein
MNRFFCLNLKPARANSWLSGQTWFIRSYCRAKRPDAAASRFTHSKRAVMRGLFPFKLVH